MCFTPQRRALFRHLNFQKWSEREVFLAFSLANVLRARMACTFSTSQLPKVVRTWCVFVRALFRHLNFQKWPENGVFCTFWLRNVLRSTTACNFSFLIWPDGSAPPALASLVFDPPEPQIIGKTVFRDFPTFSRICIFFLLTLSLLWSSLFYSSLLSDSSHLCFSSVHIVGSLTSKLPSNIPSLSIRCTMRFIVLRTFTMKSGQKFITWQISDSSLVSWFHGQPVIGSCNPSSTHFNNFAVSNLVLHTQSE